MNWGDWYSRGFAIDSSAAGTYPEKAGIFDSDLLNLPKPFDAVGHDAA